MKIFDSPIFGKIQEPETFDELLSLLTEENIKNKECIPVRFWRGQSDIAWKIDSAAYRRILIGKTYGTLDDSLISYEEDLLQHATHKGFRYHNGHELYDFELLGRLQHHGAATRLIDFSKNALIALYFCVINDLKKTGLLFGLHSSFVIGNENVTLKETYSQIIKECDEETPTTWEPPVVSTRIAAQHSQFLFSKVSDDVTGSLKLPKEPYAKLFIAISPKMKKISTSILECTFDFRTLTLFPDIDGFGMANNLSKTRWEMDRW